MVRKFLLTVCAIAMVALTACQTSPDAVKQSCEAVSVAYSVFSSSGLGSEKDRAAVDAAYATVQPICANPASATPTQLALVAGQLVFIASKYKKVKKE